MAKRLTTAQLIRKLCHELGHDEGAAPCIKKLVQEHWLERVEHLRKVPRSRLERWGIPLKLADELVELLMQDEAEMQLHDMQAYVNYTVRPRFQQFVGSQNPWIQLREDAERRQQPRVWAAKRLQRSFRRRKQRRLREEAEKLERRLLQSVQAHEISMMNEKDKAKLREKRALEKIRRLVRSWKARKNEGGLSTSALFATAVGDDLTKYYDMCPSGAGSLVVAVSARHSDGQLKDCEVTILLKRFAKKMQKEWEEIQPYAHRIVTFNWIEDVEDLDIIEDKHWDEWDFPELLVVLIKGEVEANGRPGLRSAFCSCFTGTASCCLGDLLGCCCDYVTGWWSYSDDKEKQAARDEERRRFQEEEEEEEEERIERMKALPPPPPKAKMRRLVLPSKKADD